MRTAILALALALPSLALTSCSDPASSSVVVALSSEASVPEGVSAIRIRVNRGDATFYDQRFVTTAVDQLTDPSRQLTVEDIPGTLTVRDDGKADGPVTVTIEAEMNDPSGGPPRRATRTARVGFVAEKQKLLRMPIQFACAALGDICATQGLSCRAGQCIRDEDLEALDADFEDADQATVQPDRGPCFAQRALAEDSPKGLVAAVPIETVVSLLQEADDGTCTLPHLLPELKADNALLGRILQAAGQADATTKRSLVEDLNTLRARTNMGYIWSPAYNPENAGATLQNARWTVVDQDRREGWLFGNQQALAKGDPTHSTKPQDTSAPASGDDLTTDDLDGALGALSDAKESTLAGVEDAEEPAAGLAIAEVVAQRPAFRIAVAPGLCAVLKHDRDVVNGVIPGPTYLMGTLEQRETATKTRTQPTCR
ncbi:MAG: hypothetical protein EOO75_05540 [Myxococcales bacterium]|nr:MAG: hypothetical protein EOO75_05540 [Myxococcales bacterium]